MDSLGEERDTVLGAGIANDDLIGYIVPWHVYRAFYEALYETTYRPNNLPIPLHILAWNPRELVKGIGI